MQQTDKNQVSLPQSFQFWERAESVGVSTQRQRQNFCVWFFHLLTSFSLQFLLLCYLHHIKKISKVSRFQTTLRQIVNLFDLFHEVSVSNKLAL